MTFSNRVNHGTHRDANNCGAVFQEPLGISSGSTDLRSCTATKATSTASQVIVYSSVMLETGMGVKFQFRYVVSSTAKKIR